MRTVWVSFDTMGRDCLEADATAGAEVVGVVTLPGPIDRKRSGQCSFDEVASRLGAELHKTRDINAEATLFEIVDATADSGAIIGQVVVDIEPDETATTLFDRKVVVWRARPVELDEVRIVVVTDGSSTQYPDDAATRARKEDEAVRAATELGVTDYVHLDLPDMRLDTLAHVEVNSVVEEHAIRAAASFYGPSCGCEYAEPFVLVRGLEPA